MLIKVLIIEDDIDLGNLLVRYLKLHSFLPCRVFNGEEARAELKNNSYDILIIDVMMPVEDGFTLAEKLNKQWPGLPYLFVTARNMQEDILKGLQYGADDYITKPFNVDELILRLRNILKRKGHDLVLTEDLIKVGIYDFHPKNMLLTSASERKILTEKEVSLLEHFCRHKGEIVKRSTILNAIWNQEDYFTGRSLDVFISRLRKYLAEDSNLVIESIRGVGFRFLDNTRAVDKII